MNLATRPLMPIQGVLAGAAVALVLIATVQPASAEERSVHGDHEVVRWTTHDGLPSNIVRAIAETPDGFVWVGTWSGLARFDGARFEVFDRSNAPELGGIAISCLAVDGAGTLWVGTHSGQVSRLREGRFEAVSPRLKAGLRHLEADGTGVVWAGGSGLARWDGAAFQPVLDGQIWKMWTGPHDSVWISNREGLRKVRAGDVAPPGVNASEADGPIVARLLATAPSAQGPSQLWDWLVDRSGACWWVNGAGVHRISSAEITRPGIDWARDRRVLPLEVTGHVRAVIQVRDGAILLGTEQKGLLQIRRQPSHPVGQFLSVVPMEDGSFWATDDGTPVHQTREGQRIETLGEFKRAFVSRARGGGIWIAHPGGYARLMEGQLQTFEPLAELGPPRGPLLEDRKGRLWWRGEGSAILCIEQGRVTRTLRGKLWSEGSDGALLVKPESGVLSRLRDGVFEATGGRDYMSVLEDSEGRVWSGTKGFGLSCHQGDKGSFLTTRDGLPHNVIGSIVEDGQRRLWINSNAGVFVAMTDDLVAVVEGERREAACRLVTHTEMGHLPSALGPHGSLFVHTVEGYHRIDTRALPPLPPPPRAFVEEVLHGDRRSLAVPRVELDPGVRSVRIRYTAPSLQAWRRLRFRYRLDGVDKRWVAAGPDRVAPYGNLPPGDHTFRVASRYLGGNWGEEASMRFVVPARIHETTWFRVLGLLVLGAAASTLLWYRGRAARARVRAMEAELERHRSEENARGLARRLLSAQEDERKRIALELHDDINQRLALLTLGLETRPDDVDGHVAASRELSRDVHRLSHDLHPSRLEQFGLAAALRSVVRDLRERGGVETSFESTGDAEWLDEETALGLYRIGQEALANILRHSGATHARARLTLTDDQVDLIVEDDGAGFDTDSVEAGGLGLGGMKERAEVAGGRLTIDAVPGTGTRIHAWVPRRRSEPL